MKIKIGFLHSVNKAKINLKGSFKLLDQERNFLKELNSCELKTEIRESRAATYDWYQKIDQFTKQDEIEKYKDKYYFQDTPIRIEKVGKQINEYYDNFEYWVLKKIVDHSKSDSDSSNFEFKKIYKKKPEGSIRIGENTVQNRFFLVPSQEEAEFEIENVTVGIGFHWEYQENLAYKGELEVIIDNKGQLTFINIIDLEEYLIAVNSSEMRNDNNLEMLKAQTITARGTVLATMGKHHFMEGFDLCGDDHCQCYQGTKRVNQRSKEVTLSTKSQVLIANGKICDTRYAKICGGITEKYSVCWEDIDYSYLRVFSDSAKKQAKFIENEEDAKNFIDDQDYDCFCNTNIYSLPKSLEFSLPNFRWEKLLSQSDLDNFLNKKMGFGLGRIKELISVKRGKSGRIYQLKVVGEKREVLIQKELEIRKSFSDSHLPSSCFYLKANRDDEGFITELKIRGAGWGHGVGLCQIGAQIMGELGYNYEEILKHYYKGCSLRELNFKI